MAEHLANPSGSPTPTDVTAHAARLHAAFVQALTVEDIQVITRKLVEQAREGDRTSARLVLKYGLSDALGDPKHAAAAKRTARRDPAELAFVADAAKVLRELDALEAEARRQGNAAAGFRAGNPAPGTARR